MLDPIKKTGAHAAAAHVPPTLEEGAIGPEVKVLQEKLAAAGDSPGAIDGDFGPRTAKAVKAFQSRHHLAPNGVVGPATWTALDAGKAKPHARGNVLPGSAGRLSGIDFSSNNFQNDSVSAADHIFAKDIQGQEFSFVKATEGTGYTNPYFSSQWKILGADVKSGHMALRGAYAYLTPGTAADGVAQAKHFLATVGVKGKLPAGTRLALDWEGGALKTPEVLRAAGEYIHHVTGSWPFIYTSTGTMDTARQMLPKSPRWEANYGPSYRGIANQGGKDLPSPGDSFYQYSDGRGYGRPYDMNVFNGTLNALRKLAGFPAHRPAPRGAKAVSVAKSVLGQNIETLKYHGVLARYLDKSVSDHLCCANFVSACLQKAGEIKAPEHSDSCYYLLQHLKADRRWAKSSLAHAKPGDVVIFNVPGEGAFGHVELFEGWSHGKPVFIGSNNINPDGSQRVSQGEVGYGITAVMHFHG